MFPLQLVVRVATVAFPLRGNSDFKWLWMSKLSLTSREISRSKNKAVILQIIFQWATPVIFFPHYIQLGLRSLPGNFLLNSCETHVSKVFVQLGTDISAGLFFACLLFSCKCVRIQTVEGDIWFYHSNSSDSLIHTVNTFKYLLHRLKPWKCFRKGGMKRIYFCIPVLREK